MRGRVIAIVAVAAVLLGLLGFLLTRTLLGGDSQASPGPAGAAGSPAGRQCAAVASVDADGQPLDPFWLDQVRAVHDAACHHDYARLTALMDEPFRNKPPAEVVNAWRTGDPDGARLDVLSALLETQGTQDQGGLIFCRDGDGAAAFARGTVDRPGKWSDFAIFTFHEGTEAAPGFSSCG